VPAFTAALARLGPFGPSPLLAVAVSGGADSMALAWLADRWARAHAGAVVALIVDHGLRSASAAEAALTATRLAEHGIAARILTLTDLAPGPGLAARARGARYAALAAACRAAGIVHLLLGHHAADQSETLAMRLLAGSAADGLAGMAPLVAMEDLLLLRPMLAIPPGDLRALLRAMGWAWVEDPSNHNPLWQRARLRALRRDRDGRGPATRALVAAAARRQTQREQGAQAIAATLAARATLSPLGYALLSPGPILPTALQALLRMLGAAHYPPAPTAVAALAAAPRPATLAGVRLLPAGRLGPPGTLLLVREAAAMAPAGAAPLWDRRFRLGHKLPAGTTLGPLGADARHYRHTTHLPAAILATLPCLRRGAEVIAVPHLDASHPIAFTPPQPASIGLQPA